MHPVQHLTTGRFRPAEGGSSLRPRRRQHCCQWTGGHRLQRLRDQAERLPDLQDAHAQALHGIAGRPGRDIPVAVVIGGVGALGPAVTLQTAGARHRPKGRELLGELRGEHGGTDQAVDERVGLHQQRQAIVAAPPQSVQVAP